MTSQNYSSFANLRITWQVQQAPSVFHLLASKPRTLKIPYRDLNDIQDLDNATKENIADALQRIVSLIELGPNTQEDFTSVEHETAHATDQFDRLIYVIDDDDLLAREIASQLHYFDYEVETFPVISQALEAIKLRIPSAMIIDIQLPEGDLAGPDFAKLFNEFSSTHVPSIFISSRDDWQARLAAVQAKGSAYLTKPIDFNDLLERLEQLTMRHTPEPFKILIVDDMEVLAEHYATVLRNAGMQVKTISEIDDLLEDIKRLQTRTNFNGYLYAAVFWSGCGKNNTTER